VLTLRGLVCEITLDPLFLERSRMFIVYHHHAPTIDLTFTSASGAVSLRSW
jgi:hypothetical protein